MTPLNRRELIASILGSSFMTMGGCDRHVKVPAGELLNPNFAIGHSLRDRMMDVPTGKLEHRTRVVIVGGGIAGLSAAWQLRREGIEDFVLLELEEAVGGTAKSGSRGKFAYPWGAHYVPTPMRENRSLIELFREMQVIEPGGDDDEPVVGEQFLCRDPEERVFFEGRWHEGLYPGQGASDEDLQQLARFQTAIDEWVSARDEQGQRLFTIPTSRTTRDARAMKLDRQSMSQWMDENGFTSERLRWLVDYSCRDDYGVNPSLVSAWAGLFYFSARQREKDSESQAVITWPEGNGRIVHHLADHTGDRIQSGYAVASVEQNPGSDVTVISLDVKTNQWHSHRCEQVIFAAPQYMAAHLISDLPSSRLQASKAFQYSAWVVANVHLSDRPQEHGFPMCWDNVIYGSNSLGYVTSTHQTGNDHGSTVLTWYYPMSAADGRLSRKELLSLGWEHWSDIVMSDLLVAHPDIGSLVNRIDVMRWGHAMVTPGVGFIDHPGRREAARPLGAIHFAGTDLSGIPLMEEAFDHGTRAASEVAGELMRRTSSSKASRS
ncbi:hypothetical protein Pla22_11130 [Rubripirellula amarantea]|uniref:Amine oxidase domain-containing protein n=1 Tax=Rubripirellula amarantea TaxID=2527999 RepID=A0A5C5WRG0_9BACT|nr:FAD-dependent oxidoreductase [Rubripirellula amarantea]TWT53484.1 hypothetical protein Pla22_11130 [Rubripirellula amarantea]